MKGNASFEQDNRALIFEIKGNSLDDGPGIRTVVFFKGCPLDCLWCHNPESKKARIEIGFNAEKCIGCDSCISVCPEKALNRSEPSFIMRNKCNLCLKCIQVCPSNAISQIGKYLNIEEVMDEIEKDIPFFSSSGGGITLSGGEPTIFMDFASQLLMQAKKKGIGTLIETCGYFDYERFHREIFPYIDMIYYDIKLHDPITHKRFCGKTNELIMNNLGRLSKETLQNGARILPRIPLIPGITATRDNLIPIAFQLKKLGMKEIELLPYNPLWVSKAAALDQKNKLSGDASMMQWMTPALVDECKEYFTDFIIL